MSGFVEAALVASCRDCGGVKAIECEPQGDNKQVQRWIDRGDIIGAEVISVVRSQLARCTCRSEEGSG